MANLKSRAQQLAAELKQRAKDEKNRVINERSKPASEYTARILETNVPPGQWKECADVEDVRREWGVADGLALCATVDGIELIYVQGRSERRRAEPVAIPSLWVRTIEGVEKIDEMADLARVIEAGS